MSSIAEQKQAIIDQYGEWTNHNMHLADGLYTIAPEPTPSEPKLRRMTQVAMDYFGGSVEGLRVLDLACLEGMYGLELARQGAQVVGIEGREANLAKARFVQKTWGLDNIEFFQDDVRNLSPEKYGTFDLVFCLGIYYHLDAPDVFKFMDQVSSVCNRLAIVDTHVSMTAEAQHDYDGLEIWGRDYHEFDSDTPKTERDKILWASLDNPKSFWLTRPSLFNLMGKVGFTSVYECHQPLVQKFVDMRRASINDRATFVAVKGQSVQLQSSALSNSTPGQPWTEAV
ncbi:MAG: class I SAM-dependent methyltransferase [Cyanobacteria bacterium P01_D01_bin.73]